VKNVPFEPLNTERRTAMAKPLVQESEANKCYLRQVRQALNAFYLERGIKPEELDARVHRQMVLHGLIKDTDEVPALIAESAPAPSAEETALDALGDLG
jgi:hypothetical protein